MTARIINGKQVALELQHQMAEEIRLLPNRKPGLAFILIGDHPASQTYVQAKKKACQATGIVSSLLTLPDTTTQEELLDTIDLLNKDPHIDGILVQLPLPLHISDRAVMEAISPHKDVDGFHPLNMGKLLLGDSSALAPCTPSGIKKLLSHYHIPVAGKHVVIVGRSNIVGKPLAALLMQKKEGCNATVTIAHSKSENLPQLARSADILIAAMGTPRLITQNMIKQGATVIDVGINRLHDRTLVGDVDFHKVKEVASWITPVPGGIGPMTIAMLLQNTLLCYRAHKIN